MQRSAFVVQVCNRVFRGRTATGRARARRVERGLAAHAGAERGARERDPVHVGLEPAGRVLREHRQRRVAAFVRGDGRQQPEAAVGLRRVDVRRRGFALGLGHALLEEHRARARAERGQELLLRHGPRRAAVDRGHARAGLDAAGALDGAQAAADGAEAQHGGHRVAGLAVRRHAEAQPEGPRLAHGDGGFDRPHLDLLLLRLVALFLAEHFFTSLLRCDGAPRRPLRGRLASKGGGSWS